MECERLIASSGLPYTILRATQFHGFVASFFDVQTKSPVLSWPVDGRISFRLENENCL